MLHVPVPRYLDQPTRVGLPSANTSSVWTMAITRYRLLVSTYANTLPCNTYAVTG